jgi:hypothetical protein
MDTETMTIAWGWGIVVMASIAAGCSVMPDQKDMDTFVARREVCDHLRGEFPDPPNPERVKEVTNGIKEYCTGTDAKLAELKFKYTKYPIVMKKLNTFEPLIESTRP